MARIARIAEGQAEEQVKLALRHTREGLAQLTGRELERAIEPLELYAHAPGLLAGIGALEQATAELSRVDKRYRALAELKTATLVQCEYCIDLGSLISRRWGLSEEELLGLPAYRTNPLFSELDRRVLEFAVGMSQTPVEISDELVAMLREHFDDAQLVELTHVIALENMRSRFNIALGVGAAGFSEGMVCAVAAAAT